MLAIAQLECVNLKLVVAKLLSKMAAANVHDSVLGVNVILP